MFVLAEGRLSLGDVTCRVGEAASLPAGCLRLPWWGDHSAVPPAGLPAAVGTKDCSSCRFTLLFYNGCPQKTNPQTPPTQPWRPSYLERSGTATLRPLLGARPLTPRQC